MGTGFSSLHPVPVAIYYLFIFCFSMLLLHPLFLGSTWLSMLLLWLLVDRKGSWRRSLPFILLFGLILALANPLFSHRGATILTYFREQPLTLESIVYGFLMMGSLLALLFAFASLNDVLTADRLLFLLGSLIPRTALVVRMTMRFIPLLLRRWKEVVSVQRSVGFFYEQGSRWKRARKQMQLFSILLTWSLEEGIQTAQSMRARGFGLGKRTVYHQQVMGRLDWLFLLLISLTGLAVLLISLVAGVGQWQVYPRLAPLTLSTLGWYTYVIYVLFLILPWVMEGREWWLWHRSK